MTLIKDVTRLKKLAGRRLAIIERTKNTSTPNHALLERLEIEKEMLNVFPMLLDVLAAFQDEDSIKLRFLLSGEYNPQKCNCEYCQQTTAVLRRLAEAANKMEAM